MHETREKAVSRPALHRCPFCHEDTQPEGSVACQGCLARHHEACWAESGQCGACGGERQLAPTALAPLSVEQAASVLRERGYAGREVQGFFETLTAARPAQRRRGWFAPLLALLLLVGGGLAALPISAMVAETREQNAGDRVLIQQLRPDELDAWRELTEIEAELDRVRLERDRAERTNDAALGERCTAELNQLMPRRNAIYSRHTELQRRISELEDRIRRRMSWTRF